MGRGEQRTGRAAGPPCCVPHGFSMKHPWLFETNIEVQAKRPSLSTDVSFCCYHYMCMRLLGIVFAWLLYICTLLFRTQNLDVLRWSRGHNTKAPAGGLSGGCSSLTNIFSGCLLKPLREDETSYQVQAKRPPLPGNGFNYLLSYCMLADESDFSHDDVPDE